MQKRLIAILVVLMTVIGVSAAHATPTDELTVTASYLPDNTWLYASIRTDAGYSETLNGLLARLDANTGGDMIPDDAVIPPIADLVNLMIFGNGAQTELVDSSWVGNSAALAVAGDLDPNGSPSIYVVFELADSAKLAESLTSAGATLTEGDGYTMVDASTPPIYAPAVFNDEVLILSIGMDDPAGLFALSARLSDNVAFQNVMGMLPTGDYNISGYVDLGVVLDLLNTLTVPQSADMSGADAMSVEGTLLSGMDTLSGQLAFGLTTFDGRTLAIDVAAVPSDPAAFASQPGFNAETPINADFARHIPGDTQFLIEDNNLSGDVDAMIAALDAISPQLQAVLDMAVKEAIASGESTDGMEQLDLATLNLGGILKNSVIPLFAGLTGLNLEDDVLGWMTEDYAYTASLLPVPGDLSFTFDITFLAAVTDAEAAANVVEKLATASDLYGLGATREENAVVYGDVIPALLRDSGLPESALQAPELDFLVAANENVFAIGSRPGVQFALYAETESLLDNPVYQTASSYFVDNAYSIWYVNGTALADAIGALSVVAESPADTEGLQFLVAQIESMTISFSMKEDGTSTGRLTLTLPEGVPYPVPVDETGNATSFGDMLVSLNKVAPIDLPSFDTVIASNPFGN